MNYLYLNNPSQQQQQLISRPTVFNKRNERIDWRRIAAVDVDRVAREMDFQVLQDNIEQIALCNIDVEVDSRAMDPNFVKLYKIAQLTIEYLLLCQDQITHQLVDYEQIKNKSFQEDGEFRREIEKLKNDLNTTKKESKKRKKMIETQQKMLMAQHSNYHTCPVCTHSFLSADYLRAHMSRRHPEYDPNRNREHDIDMEKEIQRLKHEFNSKETELQHVKVQKAVDEEKIRDRDEANRRLKDENQLLTSKVTMLEEKYFSLKSSTQTQSPSPHRRDPGVKELLKENKTLRSSNEQLNLALQQAEHNVKKEEKSKRRCEREIEKLQRQITDLNETLRSLQNTSGDTGHLTQELVSLRSRYDAEKVRRKKLQDELDEANNHLAQLRHQPPPVIDRKSPVPPPRSSASPPPAPIQTRPSIRPTQTTEIYLPQYCPGLVRQINQNPRFLAQYRDDAKIQFVEELEQNDYLGIREIDTRLNTTDYEAKMKIVLETRHKMQHDLPDFERVRADLSRTVDQLVHERMGGQHEGTAPLRLSGGKLVTFKDPSAQQRDSIPTKKPSTSITTVQSKPKYDHNHPTKNYGSDDDKKASINTSESDDEFTHSTKHQSTSDIHPSPRKQVSSAGISSLVTSNMRPSITSAPKTVSALVRPESTIHKYKSNSDSDSPPSNVAVKTRIIDRKLTEISAKGQKPGVNAVAQGFQPSQRTLASSNYDDDKSDSSLTSIDDTIPQRKTSTGLHPQNSGREIANNNHHHHLSSADASQYTYDSALKSQHGKGADFRRPQTADSAKTSIMDSEEDDSN